MRQTRNAAATLTAAVLVIATLAGEIKPGWCRSDAQLAVGDPLPPFHARLVPVLRKRQDISLAQALEAAAPARTHDETGAPAQAVALDRARGPSRSLLQVDFDPDPQGNGQRSQLEAEEQAMRLRHQHQLEQRASQDEDDTREQNKKEGEKTLIGEKQNSNGEQQQQEQAQQQQEQDQQQQEQDQQQQEQDQLQQDTQEEAVPAKPQKPLAEVLNEEESEADLAQFADLQVNFRSKRLNKVLTDRRTHVRVRVRVFVRVYVCVCVCVCVFVCLGPMRASFSLSLSLPVSLLSVCASFALLFHIQNSPTPCACFSSPPPSPVQPPSSVHSCRL